MSNQNPPSSYDELVKNFKNRAPDAIELNKMIDFNMYTDMPISSNAKISFKPNNQIDSHLKSGNQNVLSISQNLGSFGKHSFLPRVELKKIDIEKENNTEMLKLISSKPHIPKHLPYQVIPDKNKEQKKVNPRFKSKGIFGKINPHIVYPPDNRFLFDATYYPYGAIGRITTPLGTGTGVMVGPRHVLTVSHAIDWDNTGGGWVVFEPAFFGTTAPFGSSFGTRVYFQDKVRGSIGSFEGRRDYAVVVLNDRIGEITGWHGTKSYNNSWDGSDYWFHLGYPSDMSSIFRTMQVPISLNAVGARHRAMRMSHRGDSVPGHSGGPFFGMWEDGPYVVALQSHEYSGVFGSRNYASGGRIMTGLVRKAIDEWP